MTHLDEQGRPETPLASGETETLVGFLEYQRATFAWKCSGLDAAGLKVTVGASTMTLARPRTVRRTCTRSGVRWIVLHMIEEYARHNGHADLIRESVDGLVGE
jgi:hypothetical protein